MRFDGASQERVDADGSLVLTLAGGDVTQKAPVTYQRMASGEVVSVASAYKRENDGSYSIQLRRVRQVPQVDRRSANAVRGIPGGRRRREVPSAFPRTRTILFTSPALPRRATFRWSARRMRLSGVARIRTSLPSKLNPLSTGDDVITYSGYFGGMFGDSLKAAVVDPNGVLYMTGYTDDFYFPTTPSGYAVTNGETRKMFLAVLDTKIPYTDRLEIFDVLRRHRHRGTYGIALGPVSGQVYITGFTNGTDYPVKNALQSTLFNKTDGFVAAFDTTQSGAASCWPAPIWAVPSKTSPCRSRSTQPARRTSQATPIPTIIR